MSDPVGKEDQYDEPQSTALAIQDDLTPHLLGILLHLHPSNIPESIFLRAWRWAELHLQDTEEIDRNVSDVRWGLQQLSPWHLERTMNGVPNVANPVSALHETLGRLVELGLVVWDREAARMMIDSELQRQLRRQMSHHDRVTAWTAAIATLTVSTERDSGERAFSTELRLHLEACFALQPPDMRLLHDHGRDICRSYYYFWWQLYRARSTQIAAVMERLDTLVTQSGQMTEDIVGSGNLHLLQRIKGFTFYEAGDYDNSIRIEREQLSSLRDICGPESIAVRRAQDALAQTLNAAERYEEALQLLTAQLELEKTCADGNFENDRYLSTVHSLGITYANMRKHTEAVQYLEEVVKARERRVEVADRSQELIISRCALASVYCKVGRTAEAVGLLEAAVNSEATSLDPDCRPRLSNLYELGQAYSANGQPEKAVDIFADIVRRQSRLLSWDSLDLQRSKHELARAHLLNGTTREGIHFVEEVVDLEASVVGNELEFRFTSIHLLVECYIRTKDLVKARKWLQYLEANARSLSSTSQDAVQLLQTRTKALEDGLACEQDSSDRMYDIA